MGNLLKDYLTDKQKALLWDLMINIIIECNCDTLIEFGKVLDHTLLQAKEQISINLEQVNEYLKSR